MVYKKLKKVVSDRIPIMSINALSNIVCPTSCKKRIPITIVKMINIANESLSPVKSNFNPITAPKIS